MSLLYTFCVLGYEPVPWQPPRVTRSGRTYKQNRKEDINQGIINVSRWMGMVSKAASIAMGDDEPLTCQLAIHIDFYVLGPPESQHGDLWPINVEKVWDKQTKRQRYVKRARNGRPEADGTNLYKSTEDAMGGIVYADDALNRQGSWACWYGKVPGARIWISDALEYDDDC